MGGPWHDRNYVPSVPAGARPTGGPLESRPSDSLLGAYLAGFALGAIFGVTVLWIVSPWLPFGVLR